MSTQPAYQFDFAGQYIGATAADESPLEPDVFLLPARSTFAPPPAQVPDDKWPRWNGVAWDLINRPAPVADSEGSPLEKLQAFLLANPDVADLINAPTGQEDST